MVKGKKRKQRPGQLELTSAGALRTTAWALAGGQRPGRPEPDLWLSPHELEKEFNAAKHVNLSLAFVTEVSKFVAQDACRNYRNARARWLNQKLKARRPVFHKKNRTGTGSFLAASGVKLIQYDGHRRIRLPYLGSVKMTRSLLEGIAHEVTIRKRNGRWYASIAYWKPPIAPPQRETQSVGGVDVGISPLAVDSDSVHYQNPKALDGALRKLRRWQRAKERRTLGSRGWWEAQRRLDAVQRRVTGLRNNAHHQVSWELVRKYHTLGIETLNVAGMIKAGLQSKALSDAGMSNLLRQIRYKAQWCGTRIVAADQWYPSSKTCSACGVGEQGSWSGAPLVLPQLRRHSRPQRERSPQPAETCATRGRRGCDAPGRGSAGQR